MSLFIETILPPRNQHKYICNIHSIDDILMISDLKLNSKAEILCLEKSQTRWWQNKYSKQLMKYSLKLSLYGIKAKFFPLMH